jgi:hypothetical protein
VQYGLTPQDFHHRDASCSHFVVGVRGDLVAASVFSSLCAGLAEGVSEMLEDLPSIWEMVMLFSLGPSNEDPCRACWEY